MKKERGLGQGLLDGVKRLLTLWCPRERLGLSFKRLKEMIEVRCCFGNETPIISHHAKEALELLDSGGWCCGADCVHSIGKWSDAVAVNLVA